MPTIDFAQYYYYPCLQSTHGEHLGYRNLSDDDKDTIVPIFELSQRGDASDLNGSIDLIRSSVGDRPFLLDLCKDPAPLPFISHAPRDPVADAARIETQRAAQSSYNAVLTGLLNPTDGFATWRALLSMFPNAVPILQFSDAAQQSRQLLRQAALLARDGQSIGIRITQESGTALYPTIAQIMSIIDSPDQLLVIIDCGQGRQTISQRSEFARNSILTILGLLEITEQSLVRAVCMSNSFPRPNHDLLRQIASMDWRLWREARYAFPFMFGDYAGMYRIRRQNTFVPSDSRPTVTFPLDDGWSVYRHPNVNDSSGWIDGSVAVMADASFDAPACRGVDLIRQAASGDLHDANSARFWHASKVNIHIHRQIRYSEEVIINYDEDEL